MHLDQSIGSMRLIRKRIDDALNSYGKAYYELKSIADLYPDLFPSSTLSSGTIAEFYAMLYLRHSFPDAQISFGHGSQKGWDIQVAKRDGEIKLYQVKASSAFSKSRDIARPTRGFDVLLALALDADFNVSAAYAFEGNEIVQKLVRCSCLIIPDTSVKSRRGSAIFREAKDISQDFNHALSEHL
jgi:hypothetical protein